jgi:hypothetical protein
VKRTFTFELSNMFGTPKKTPDGQPAGRIRLGMRRTLQRLRSGRRVRSARADRTPSTSANSIGR